MICPKCGGGSRVSTSRPVIGLDGGRVRWRVCGSCGHRWYTWQAPEIALPIHAVTWAASDVLVDRQELRRAREAQP